MNMHRPDAPERRPSTRYWGAIAIPALALGWGVGLNATAPWTWMALPLAALGIIGLLLTGLSTYHRRLHGARRLDEREVTVLQRANTYAYRLTAATAVLFAFYASVAARPGSHLWFPTTSQHWQSLLWPLVLALPVLPAVIAEWLDRA